MSDPSSSSSSTAATTAPTTTAPAGGVQPRKPSGTRMPLPSLNQLAAKLKPEAAERASTVSTPRPRLAASVLRTGSSVSVNTTTSNADSLAVNAPSTRSVTPSTGSVDPATTTTTAAASSDAAGQDAAPGGGEALTAEKLEKLNQETAGADGSGPGAEQPPQRKKAVGYKNIPSLDAIARLVKARASHLSIDGTERPPEAPMIEDPKTPGLQMKAPEHPLQFSWTIYHDQKAKYPFTPATATTSGGFNQPPPGQTSSSVAATAAANAAAAGGALPDPPYSASHPPEQAEYEAGLTVIGEFSTVEEFFRYFNWLKPPSKLEKNSNYHIFKSGIKPMWEDPANAEGGKWVLTMKNSPALLDRCWSWLAMALVGEELEEDGDEICGAVVSLRTKVDRIQVWTRGKEDVEKLNGIAKKLVKLLDVSEADNIGLEFQYNSEDRPPPNKFLSIQSAPISTFRPGFPSGPGGGGNGAPPTRQQTLDGGGGGGSAFGAFGTGMGIGSQAWKSGGKR